MALENYKGGTEREREDPLAHGDHSLCLSKVVL
jgi:hypothetical protein